MTCMMHDISFINRISDASLEEVHVFYHATHPVEQSEAGWGAFYFSAYSDSYQVTRG